MKNQIFEKEYTEGQLAYKEEKIKFILMIYTFTVMALTSIITSLYIIGKINFVFEFIFLLSVAFAGMYLYEKEIKKVFSEMKKENKPIKKKF